MNVGVNAPQRLRVSRDDHKARMREAEEMLFSAGWAPTHAARMLADKHGCSVRQAHRYIAAVRALYRQAAERTPGTNLEEMVTVLQAVGAQAKQGPDEDNPHREPDYKASIKAFELAARLQGWLDRRSTLTVNSTLTVQHVPALDGASDDELAALAAYHDARARRVAAGDGERTALVGTLGELTTSAKPQMCLM